MNAARMESVPAETAPTPPAGASPVARSPTVRPPGRTTGWHLATAVTDRYLEFAAAVIEP